MFHFPTFPPHTLYIQMRVTRHHSCWVSPFGNPRISARLTAPRGLSQPPTSFIGSWCQGIHRTLLNTYKQRCSRPLCSSQTTHKTEPDATPARTTALRYDCESSLVVILPKRKHSRVLSGPNSVSIYPPRSKTQLRPPAMKPVSVPPMSIRRTTYASETVSATDVYPPTTVGVRGEVLLRKEVIQPHLPVRLPCYDFVPIANPTFDGSLPQGVRPPASGVTDFHDVTGGVYKARERIHRSVADLRLLATPTSRGRVADPDPN
jgi:hypothetical protein